MKRLMILAILCMAITAAATTSSVLVDPLGGGDYLTIQEAYDAVDAGGTIHINPGMYDEWIIPVKSVSLDAVDGLGTVLLDGGGTHQLFDINAPVTIDMTGLVFQHARVEGESGVGAAIHVSSGAQININNCSFVQNYAGHDCALSAQGAGTVVTVTDTDFTDNYAEHNSAACGVLFDASLVIDRCTFVRNTSPGICGAVASYYAPLAITNSLFLDNDGGTYAAIRVYGGAAEIRNNTFHDNDAGWVIYASSSNPVVFERNLVTTNVAGGGLYCSANISHIDNIYFDLNGQSASCGLGSGELVEEPQFCNYPVGDFALCATSPAATHPAGLIGAFGVNCSTCGPIADEPETWGGVKSFYR